MAPNDSDDASFAEEMARLGVAPLSPSKQNTGKARSRQRAPARPPQKTAGGRPSGPARAPQAPARDSHALAKDLAELRQQLAQARADCKALEAERAEWQRERAELVEKWQRERVELTGRWDTERGKLAARDRALREKLDRAEGTLAQHMSLGDALEERGCVDVSEAITVLQGLLDQRPRELLEAVDMISTQAFKHLLDQRVAFVADHVDMDVGPDCVIVRVPAVRCEITGGSDIQAGFRRFVDACVAAGCQQVTLVGGSPAYRRQLQRLSRRHGKDLRLNLVSGTQRRTRKRAEADMRSSDLVIIWGASELDHSVSDVYMGAPEKTLIIHHRGISRMLLHVAEKLEHG